MYTTDTKSIYSLKCLFIAITVFALLGSSVC